MVNYYTDEKNVQVLVALLKKHGIRKVIASPGSANAALVGSLQYDSYFEMYSSVDERSAAYMACGLAAESGEPVVISCTGATASRNYLSGLTEAYYRKLPILSITSTQPTSSVGHHIAQVIDRSSLPKDVANLSVQLNVVNSNEELWDCEIKANQAILELKRRGGGPVHINLVSNYGVFTTKELPDVRVIDRITLKDDFPKLPEGRIAVFMGSHRNLTENETKALDKFCACNNAVVFCDHTSSYKGKYRVLYALVASQITPVNLGRPDLIIHIGEVTGDYYGINMVKNEVWRVSDDGQIRDSFKKLRYIFEMPEESFFDYYTKNHEEKSDSYLKECKMNLENHWNKIPDLPFSNVWLASKMAHLIPECSVIHFAILNSLRSWNFFELPNSVSSMSNVGGFGIDGCISSLIGASLNNKEKLYFLVVGDLAFFYDMNVLGNKHVGKNLRILIVNNGVGTEFKQYKHRVSNFGNEADQFLAAAGHFGQKSPALVRDYAQNLGFKYLSASDKKGFEEVYELFLRPEITDKPIVFEVFTNDTDESLALETIMNIEENVKGKAVQFATQILGKNTVSGLKKIIKK